ncbi:hypothetical protein PVAP13_9KG576901 [Panicum virgatum]|uniref:Uncharacterized protein n=1 Tax=Panicum virgatum TaxID=38727 RepID=A0A8T0P2C3_PANVG|nr:hypothetical protein PVAP13_9KG576901 [Panicum virgatum]
MTREDDGGAAPLSSLLRSVKAARNHDKPTLEQAQVLPHDNSAASGSFLPSHLRLANHSNKTWDQMTKSIIQVAAPRRTRGENTNFSHGS